MSPTLRPDIRDQLPLPLAQLYRRTVNAKTWMERQLNAFYLLEATTKLAASAQIAVYLRSGHRDATVDQRLRNLALPTFGQWVGFLRDTAASNARLSDHPFPALAGVSALIDSTHELPAVRQLLVAMGERVETIPKFTSSKVRLLDLLGRLVNYRNQTFGHGAVRTEDFLAPMADRLLDAAVEVFERLALLGGSVLVFVSEVRETSARTHAVELWDFMGGEALRATPPGGSEEYGAQGLKAGHLYLKRASDFLDLDPFVVCEPLPPEAQVLFLNRSQIERRVEYLNYVTGETTVAQHLLEDHRRVLGAVMGKEVDSRELRALQDASISDGDAAPVRTLDPATQRFGDFELIRRLGAGGMGEVFLARQLSLSRLVALKLLPAALEKDELAASRFQREVRALSRADHPNVVRILQSGKTGANHWYAMEYVDGCDLGDVSRALPATSSRGDLTAADVATAISKSGEKAPGDASDEPVPSKSLPREVDEGRSYFDRIAQIFEEAALGVQHLHDRQILHRDLKPANIMLGRSDGRAIVMDLGLAHIGGELSLTRTDRVLGTIRYAAPEQIESAASRSRVDARADVYGLGATLYELATGRAAYPGDDEKQLVTAVLNEDPTAPRRIDRSVPADLAAIIQKAMARDRKDRYQTASDLADDLRAFREGRPIVARPLSAAGRFKRWARRQPAKAALVAVLLLSVPAIAALGGAWIASRDDVRRVDREKRQEKIDAIVERGFLEIELRPETAIETFRQALEIERRTPEAIAGTVFAHLHRGDSAGALAAIGAHVDVEGPTTLDRLRAAVLRSDDETAKANALLAALPAPTTALEHFLIGLAEVDRGHDGDAGAYEAARDHLLRATMTSPKPVYVFELAHVAGHLKDPRLSHAVRDVLVCSWPNSPSAWHYVGNALENVDADGAIEAYERALRLCGTVDDSWPEKSLKARALNGIAEAHLSRGDFEHAMEAYRRLLETVPTYAPGYARLAYALKEAGDVEGSLKTLGDAIEKWPRTALLHRELGARLFDFGRMRESIEPFKRSLELNPKQPFLWSALTFALLRAGKWKDAADAAQSGAAVQSESAEVQIALGCALVMVGDYSGGLAAIKRMFQLDARILHQYPHIHRDLQMLSPFERGFVAAKVQAVVKVGPDYAPCRVAAGLCKRSSGNLDDAIKEFSKAVDLDPTLEWAQFNLGTALVEKKDWTRALRALRHAVRISPAFSENWLFLGHALRGAGDSGGAIDAYERVLALEPADFDAHVSLAGTFAEAGEPTLARQAMEGLVKHAPKSPNAWNALARFVSGPNARPDLLDRERGLAAARKAVEVSKRKNPWILDSLAWALFRAGDVEAAIATDEEALRMAETDPDSDKSLLDRLHGSLSRFENAATRPASESR